MKGKSIGFLSHRIGRLRKKKCDEVSVFAAAFFVAGLFHVSYKKSMYKMYAYSALFHITTSYSTG